MATSNPNDSASPSSPQSLSDKEHVSQIEESTKQVPSQAIYNADVDVSGVDEHKLMRKVDMRTVPWLAFLYLLAFLDRTSIGNAKLYSVEADLHMSDTQFLLALTLFFFSYAIFEVPSNVILKRLRPSIWLSALMFLWGIMMIVQGLITNFSGLMAVRWLLGMFEAGLLPGVTYYLSCWYKRSEFGIRIAIFFSAATVSGAFGGLLAAAISDMNGIGGKAAWSWIFILEGLATIVAGFLSFWFIVDFPDDAKFLTEAERTVVIRRLQGDDQFSAAGERLKWKNVVASLADYRTYLYSTSRLGAGKVGLTEPSDLVVVFSGGDMPLHALALFLPSIISQTSFIRDIGLMERRLQGDRRKLADGPGRGLRFLTAGPASSLGAVSANVYRANQTPWYPMGHGLVLMYICIGLISTIVLRFLLKAENGRRDRGERDEVIEGYDGGLERMPRGRREIGGAGIGIGYNDIKRTDAKGVQRTSPFTGTMWDELFRNPAKLQSEAGYYLSSLMGAVQFIETMDHTSVSNITQQAFERNAELVIQSLSPSLPSSPTSSTSSFAPSIRSPFPSPHAGEESAQPLALPVPSQTQSIGEGARRLLQKTGNVVSKPLGAISRIFSDALYEKMSYLPGPFAPFELARECAQEGSDSQTERHWAHPDQIAQFRLGGGNTLKTSQEDLKAAHPDNAITCPTITWWHAFHSRGHVWDIETDNSPKGYSWRQFRHQELSPDVRATSGTQPSSLPQRLQPPSQAQHISRTPTSSLDLSAVQAEIDRAHAHASAASRRTLAQIFPSMDAEVRDWVLEANGGDPGKSIEALLEMSGGS
ncbi:major facilitator superfamily domain-containing protein [Lanmaoa asiatica]|nr:major facilitator superfamily domain-containing protein [Lanmaoa asiatica]